jgi:hypothetical protein
MVNLHGNTDIPLCAYTEKLWYLDGSTWTEFAGADVGPLFTLDGAGDCLSAFDDTAMTFTVECATNGSTSKKVTFRYSAWWDTFGDQPASETYLRNVNSNVFTVTVRDNSFCAGLLGWPYAIAYVDSAD